MPTAPRRLLLTTVGSRGDVQPYVALGLALQRLGYTVTVATHAAFEETLRGHGLGFAPLPGDPRELLSTPRGQAWLRSANNPARFLRLLHGLVQPLIMALQEDLQRACEAADAVVFSPLTIGVLTCMERLKLPGIAAYLQPVTPTRAFASPMMPFDQAGGWLNWRTHRFFDHAFWWIMGSGTQAWRRQAGMPPCENLYERLAAQRVPVIYGFSEHVVPRPGDWPAHHHVTGYWSLAAGDAWTPPPELVAFLAAGPPPVCVGFGSMVDGNAQRAAQAVGQALRRLGQRGVFLTGWGGLEASPHSDLLCLPGAPHDWLFPRMAAVVHHGGAGTAAAGMQAGVPSIVVPFFGDQGYWARRVHALGVGARPIPHKRLTATALMEALEGVQQDAPLRQRAAALGAALRREAGAAAAAQRIDTLLNQSERSRAV